MEPLRGGGLAIPPPVVQEVYDAFPIKRRPVDWAFRHLIDRPEVSCILSGVNTLEQLKDTMSIFSAPDALPGCLKPDEKAMIARVRATYEAIPTVPCTSCKYCMPCPKGVLINRVFSTYNEGLMFDNFRQPKRAYMFITKEGKDASNCVNCGECEKKCPQHIAIPAELRKAHEALKGWIE
jgi:predicted aldo/keto reductase-like oxidoreductase